MAKPLTSSNHLNVKLLKNFQGISLDKYRNLIIARRVWYAANYLNF